MAETATKVVAAVCAIRMEPPPYWTKAADPTPAIGEPVAVEIAMVPFVTVPLMVGREATSAGLFGCEQL
jgi:hypothetical protein